MVDVNILNRNQIARFVGNDPDAIRAIERLFRAVAEGLPGEELAAGAAGNIAEAAAAVANAAARLAELASSNPAPFSENFQKLDYIDFNRVGPHVTQALRMQWNEDDGTVDFGLTDETVLQIGQETLYFAKNTSGGTIANGTPVMFAGTVGASAKLEFGLAVADGSQPANYMMGVATEDIPNNGFGYVTSFGIVRGFNTTGTPYGETWSDGDIIYFDPATPGTWTNVRPDAPNLDLPVAVVLNAASGSGSIFVRMKTGETLDSLHDVQAPSPSGGEFLRWSSANLRWQNETAALDDLTDVNAPSPANDQLLSYSASGSEWVPRTLTLASISDVFPTSLVNGAVLIYNTTAAGWQASTLTAGTNVTITNSPGGITISAAGVSGATGSFTAASGETITVSNGLITAITP